MTPDATPFAATWPGIALFRKQVTVAWTNDQAWHFWSSRHVCAQSAVASPRIFTV
jgi:hypothetical protein